MKILITALILATTTLYSSGAHNHDHAKAGHGHSHADFTESDAKTHAQKEIAHLVKTQKLAKSWEKVIIKKIEKKAFKNNMEWVVQFENLEMKDKSKQMLYIFINMHGNTTGINHSGK